MLENLVGKIFESHVWSWKVCFEKNEKLERATSMLVMNVGHKFEVLPMNTVAVHDQNYAKIHQYNFVTNINVAVGKVWIWATSRFSNCLSVSRTNKKAWIQGLLDKPSILNQTEGELNCIYVYPERCDFSTECLL